MVEWAKSVPQFNSLPLEDQVLLLKSGWTELMLAAFSHKSRELNDQIMIGNGIVLQKHSAQQAGVGALYDRVLHELVKRLKDINIDRTEIACLR